MSLLLSLGHTVLSAIDEVTAPLRQALPFARGEDQVESGGAPSNVWVVVNPSKVNDLPAFQRRVEKAAVKCGVHTLTWVETTVEDPGTGMARQAIEAGADLIIAAGGDGTVRSVAAGMTHTGVRLGIIPIGTGNVMARNLGIPLDYPKKAMKVACGTTHRRVDLGWLKVEEFTEDFDETIGNAGKEHSFLVVAGLGFDGATMAQTDPKLKKSLGWIAYVVAALGELGGNRANTRIELHDPQPLEAALPQGADDSEPLEVGVLESETIDIMTRSVLFANVGKLPFISLAPDAHAGDGMLDVVAVDTQVGIVGWADLATKIIGQGLGLHATNTALSTGQIASRQARAVTVTVDEPQIVQVDGDALGRARTVHARVDAGALIIAVPRKHRTEKRNKIAA